MVTERQAAGTLRFRRTEQAARTEAPQAPRPTQPPPQPPVAPPPTEPFPGFEVAKTDITKQLFATGRKTQEAAKKLADLQRKAQFTRMVSRHPALKALALGPPPISLAFIAAGGFGPGVSEEQVATAQAEFDTAQVEYNRLTRRQDVLFDLSAFVNDPTLGIRSADDFLSIIPEGYFDDSDVEWFREVFSRIEPLLAAELPEEPTGSIEEARKQVYDILQSEPPLEMRGVHNLTVDELVKSFTMDVAELPEGMTFDDLQDIVKARPGFSEEDAREVDDIGLYTTAKLEQWQTEVAYQELLKTGIAHIGVPDLTPTEFLKMTFTQPMLATVELLEKYFNILPRPLAAMAITAFSRLRKDSEAGELERLYQQYKDLGVDSWEAYSLAFQNWDENIWLKMAIEIVFDPTSYIGLGIATKIFRPIPYVGKFVGAVERGWLQAADVPFRAARKAYKAIPKTITAQASAVSRQAYRATRAYMNRLYPHSRNMVGITPREFEDSIKFAVGSVFETPQETGNMAVRVGRYFLEQDFIDESTVGRWLKRLGKDAEITTQRLADINDAAEMLLKKAAVPKEAAARILNTLSIDGTKPLVTKMTKILGEYKESAIKGSLDFLRGKTVKEMLDSMLTNINDLYYRKYTSPIYRHMNQAGQATGWISRVTDKVVRNNALNAIDRHLTAPIANQWLLFTNLGPLNFAEGMMRSWLGGGELLYPRRFSGVNEAVRLFDDLPNMPFELVLAERELGRMDIAIVRPKTGETMVFRGGKIPFITRDVKIPGTNRVIGKTINIGGKDYQLSSLQSWHDMWGDMATKQRAWSYVVQYKKALREVATTEVESIDDIVARNRPLLAEMTTMSKADIKDIERIAWQDATRSPANVRGHGGVPVLELERRKISKEISKIMDKHNNVMSVTKHGIRDEVLDGTMLKDIPGRVVAYKEAERELMVVGLQNEIDVLESLVKEMASVVPETSDDVLRHLGAISDMADAVADRISDVRITTRRRAVGFAQFTKAKDDFNLASGELLSDFMGVSRDSIDGMLANLRKMVAEAKLLTPEHLASFDTLSSAIKLRNANLLATRDKARQFAARTFADTPPGKGRNDAFWNKFEADNEELIWAPYRKLDEELLTAIEDAKIPLMKNLGVEPDIPSLVPEIPDRLAPTHVAYLLGVTGDDLNKGLTKVMGAQVTIRTKASFTNYVYRRARKVSSNVGKSPEEIGFSKEAIGDVYDQMWENLGIDSRLAAEEALLPTMQQLDEVAVELERLVGTSKIPDNDYLKYKQYFNTIADELEQTPMYKEATAGWLAKRETAMTQARQMHELAFPTYDDPNFVDSTMRMIFPFWTYESFRWQWLPRTYLRTPGTATAVGRYMDYTDQGYIPIGSTDIQMNMLRGSIFMGGFRRLYMRDYPEYYDAFPGMEAIDYIGRLGFYPGAQIMLPIAIWGAAGDKQPHLLEVAPAWIKSTLDAARAVAPESAGKVIDHLFPDRMKDYYTMLTLAAEGEDAQDLWRKRQPGNIGLTPEEEKLWLRAEAKAIGWKGVLFEQTGMLRLRPDEYTQLNQDMMSLIEEMTGVPVEVQEEIRRQTPVTGKRFADYFFLSELQRKIVYNSEAYRRFQGVTTPLFPSAWQEEDVRTADYYDKVETLFDDARHKGIFDEQGNLTQQSIADITQQWVDGVIGPDQWATNHGDALAHASAAAMEMGKLVYPDVPKTLEEREARLKERGVPAITYGPDRELLWKYYEIKPELRWDWEADRMTYDYDLYYAKIDMMVDTLQGEFKQELLDTIQFKWIGMERLHWQINQEYIRPYNGLRQLVLEQYDPEQVKLIRRYEVARGAERDEIRAVEGPEGRKLIAGYTAKLREVRQRYRLLDPTTDAWLNFFGKTDKLLSKEATDIYNSITKQYLTPEMYK